MKVSIFPFSISIILGLLIGYGFHLMTDGEWVSYVGALICTIFLAITLSIDLCDDSRMSSMCRIISGFSFLGLLLINGLMLGFGASIQFFIIVNGLLVAIAAYANYWMINSQK